jgi:hypothetical protein
LNPIPKDLPTESIKHVNRIYDAHVTLYPTRILAEQWMPIHAGRKTTSHLSC